MRLNGDNKDHIDIVDNVLISSLDIRIKDNVNTFNDFKLLLPNTRKSDNEIFISTILKHLNLLSPEVNLIDLEMFNINKKYLFYENLNKEFLERNNRVEGPIIRGDERFFFNKNKKHLIFARLENSNWIKQNNIKQIQRSVEAITLANRLFISNTTISDLNDDPHLKFNYSLVNGHIKLEEVKKFRLLMNAFGAFNSLSVNDVRFYYDPIFKKLDLIYNDGSTSFLQTPNKINYSYINIEEIEKIDSLIKHLNNINIQKIEQDLFERGINISKKEIRKNLDKIKRRLNSIKINKSKIKKNEKIKISRDDIDKILGKEDIITSYYVEEDKFEFCQINDCKIYKLNLKDIKKLFNQRLKKNGKYVIFIGYKNINEQIENFDDQKKWKKKILKNTKIIFSKDTKLDINKNIINIYTDKNPKVIFTGGLLENMKINYLNKGSLKNFKSETSLNGCINFYDITLSKLEVEISNSICEDSINFVRSNGNVIKIVSNNSFSDGVDFDFSNLEIKKILVNNSLNDCLDFSFGNYIIDSINSYKCGDKALSVGETSYVKINNFYSSDSNINIAVKDKSETFIKYLKAEKTDYCVAMYRKKKEFMGSKLNIMNENCDNDIKLIDPGNIYNNNVF